MLIERNNLPIQLESLMRKGVEYVSIINKRGRVEDAIYRKDLRLSKERKEMFHMGLRLQHSMQRDYNDDLGMVNYVITNRENQKFVTIPILSYVVLVVMDNAARHESIINEIKKMIKRHESDESIPAKLAGIPVFQDGQTA